MIAHYEGQYVITYHPEGAATLHYTDSQEAPWQFEKPKVPWHCMAVYTHESQYLLAAGDKEGFLHVMTLDPSQRTRSNLYREQLHTGLVNAVTFLDGSAIVTAGSDRKVFIHGFKEKMAQKESLFLSIECGGMKIEGVQSQREYELLQRLQRT